MSLVFDPRQWNLDDAGPLLNVGAFPAALRGITIQTYLDVVPGATLAERRAALAAGLKVWKQLGAVAWAPHGFTTTLPQDVPAYVAMAQATGLLCVPAFGLDDTDPAGKGKRIAAAANVPGVAAVILDAEGKLEINGTATDAKIAITMGETLCSLAPGVVTIQQPFPVVQVHRGWPYVAFGRYTSAWAPQFYCGPYKSTYGTQRVRRMMPAFAADWDALERDVLAPSGVGGIPHIVTLEAYGYQDVAFDYTAYVLANETIIFWSEWAPDATCLHALAMRQRIDRAVGLYVDGAWSGQTAVRRFQALYNQTASTPLTVDGLYGPHTEAALIASTGG